jgi:hypothetical protein
LAELWKIVQGDLCGILTQGFFLKSSRLSRDFNKNEICHVNLSKFWSTRN